MGEITAIYHVGDIVPIDSNPAAIFLVSKGEANRISYQQDLNFIARLLGANDAFSFSWGDLRYQHTQAIRAKLQETISVQTGKPLSPAYVNRMLCALRGVLKTSWRLGLMSGDAYQRAIDVDGVNKVLAAELTRKAPEAK